MKTRKDKHGNWRNYTNKGDSPQIQWKKQGEELNNHAPRFGTKIKASNRGCKCEYCTRTAKPIKEKILLSEFKKNKENF